MKHFKLILKHLVSMGIYSSRLHQKSYISIKNLRILFILIINHMFGWMFILNEANIFEEYVSSCYSCIMAYVILTDFAILVWKSNVLYRFIKDFDGFIERREYHLQNVLFIKAYRYRNILGSKKPSLKAIYLKSSHKLEKWSKVIHFALTKLTVHLMIWPLVIVSFFNYFFADLKKDAFELPFYAW